MVRVAWGKERQNCILTYLNIANSINLKSTPKYLGRYLMQASSDTRANYRPDTSYGLFIDNQWVAGDSGETLDILNPANGDIITRIPNATAVDVDHAVQAAQRAFATWRTTTPIERQCAAENSRPDGSRRRTVLRPGNPRRRQAHP